MLVHRYFDSHEFLKKTLLESEFYLSKVSGFNDPFELKFTVVGDYQRIDAENDLRRRLGREIFYNEFRLDPHFKALSNNEIKKIILRDKEKYIQSLIDTQEGTIQEMIDSSHERADKVFRVLCFSDVEVDERDELLMWAHYGDKHNGARITLDLAMQPEPFKSAGRVKYREGLLEADITQMSDLDYITELLKSSMLQKAKCWEYEKEIRVLFPMEIVKTRGSSTDEKSFTEFNRQGIHQVDFGMNCKMKQIDDVKLILRNFKHVEYRQAECSKDQFRMNYIPV